jgi:hypothetical protein
MDLALPFQLLLLLVFVGECVLHLLEAHVVHAGGVNVAADEAGVGGARKPDGNLDGSIGMVGVIQGDVNLPVHQQLSLHPALAEA